MKPITQTSYVQRAVEALQCGAWSEAEAICRAAVAAQPDDAQAWFLLGNARAHSGDTTGAEPLLEKAAALAPRDIAVLNSLGGVYGANGKAVEAKAALERAVAIDPRFVWAQQNLGGVLLELGDRSGARQRFEHALRVDPNYADAIAGLADIAERDHRLDEAARLAEKALKLAPRLTSAKITLARVALRRAEPRRAVELLRPLTADGSLRARSKAMALTLLGEAHEALGDIDEAFGAFSISNAQLRAQFAARYENVESAVSVASVRKLADFVRSVDVANWRPVHAADADPVFLIGFPRSGTTLLEQILASHPDIDVIEEEEGFASLHQELILAPCALDRWAHLSDAEVNAYRAAYWRHMKAAFAGRTARRVIVDKMPLNTAMLPLIYRLFPRAKILFAVRDPRDVVLSCFKQNFALNAAMFQFLTLEGTVRYYDEVMNLAAVSRSKFPLAILDVRYEALVDDFDRVVGGVLAFLDLPWNDAVRNFQETARRRFVRTPSAAKTTEPISRGAIGRWRLYRRWLDPHLPILRRWVDGFGYGCAAVAPHLAELGDQTWFEVLVA